MGLWAWQPTHAAQHMPPEHPHLPVCRMASRTGRWTTPARRPWTAKSATLATHCAVSGQPVGHYLMAWCRSLCTAAVLVWGGSLCSTTLGEGSSGIASLAMLHEPQPQLSFQHFFLPAATLAQDMHTLQLESAALRSACRSTLRVHSACRQQILVSSTAKYGAQADMACDVQVLLV